MMHAAEFACYASTSSPTSSLPFVTFIDFDDRLEMAGQVEGPKDTPTC